MGEREGEDSAFHVVDETGNGRREMGTRTMVLLPIRDGYAT